MLLFHSPDGYNESTSDPEDPRQFLQRVHSPLRGGKMMHHGDRQHRIEALLAERQGQIIADQDLATNEVKYLTQDAHIVKIEVDPIDLDCEKKVL